MPDLPNAPPPALTSFTVAMSQRTIAAPLWRGVRSVGLTCIAATPDQCTTLLAILQRGAPVPVDNFDAADRARVQITADLAPVDGRPAIALSARPSIVMDDAQGEWIGPAVIAGKGENFETLAERALDQALPWRGARPNNRLTGEN
ncbi:hypothetical protein [Sphingomonas sp. T9W2]|uniref:hypothetical protein n=1 Tax=Sphingomonas sp. T9W2 TaxID=3143183 RepID=UPI0031F4BA08